MRVGRASWSRPTHQFSVNRRDNCALALFLSETPRNPHRQEDPMANLLTLNEFLAQNRISRATFYRLPKKPRLVRLGRRVLIHPEDADAWQRWMAGDAR